MQSSVAFCGISATFPKAACCWQQQCHKFYIPCPSVLKITFEKKQNCILIWRILSEGAVLTVEVLLIIMLTIFLFLHLFSVFKNTPLTFPHCLYLAHAISEVSANAKLNAPRYLISLSFQMKAGVTEVCRIMSCSQRCHIMYRIAIISDQNAKFSNLFEFTQHCPF